MVVRLRVTEGWGEERGEEKEEREIGLLRNDEREHERDKTDGELDHL